LFEEPGTLEAVARLAAAWFRHFLVERPNTRSERQVLPADIPQLWP